MTIVKILNLHAGMQVAFESSYLIHFQKLLSPESRSTNINVNWAAYVKVARYSFVGEPRTQPQIQHGYRKFT